MILGYGTVNIISSVFYCGLDRNFWIYLRYCKEREKTAKTQQNNRLLFRAVIRRDSTRTATLRDLTGLFPSGSPSDSNRATPTRSGFARKLKSYQFAAESLR